MNRWSALAYAYAGLVLVGFGYFLFGVPIQLTDSYGNIIKASEGTLGSLVYAEFFQASYLRPFLWGNLRLVLDLSGGRYFEWFRGWHVAQLGLLILLFVRLVRTQTASGAVVLPLGLAALVGMHTFGGTVREAFPINTFMTILLCCYAAADLALGAPRWWRSAAAVLVFIFAALTVESGLLVAVICVTAYLTGARGVSSRGIAALMLLCVAYLGLRFVVLDVGSPGLSERSSGFGFSRVDPDRLIEQFGSNPLPFYAYNVLASLLSLLFAEPRYGVFSTTDGLLRGDPSTAGVVNVIASTMATALIGWYMWRRRAEWRARRFDRSDQLVIIFVAVFLASAAMSYAYTKDEILSPGGAFYALALTVSARHFVEAAGRWPAARAGAAAVLMLALSTAWAYRSLDAHIGVRRAQAAVRQEWAFVDEWLERENQVPTESFAIELRRHLQDDAVSRHPAPPALRGDWLEWFDDR